jgi:putative MATE family efflux protein
LKKESSLVRNLTEETPWKLIVALAIPLLFGNIFQASYNLVDTMIVGKYAGASALAGVGVASPVFNLINALLMGLSVGSSIIVSQLFGAGKKEQLPVAVSTVLWTSLGLALVLTGVGQLLVVPLLRVLDTPAEDFASAEIYLRTILCGLVCNVYYNQLAGLLRGLGNTRTPLWFLIFACCLNAGLDLLFVCGLHMGVMGAGLATVIAEGVSALLTWFYILHSVPLLVPKGARFDREMFSAAVRFGLPMGLQQASISLGHVLMQWIINPFGTALIAGYAAASKVDTFAVMPIISLGSAISAFSAQNVGAGKLDRVRKGYRMTNWITLGVCLVLSLLVVPSREVLMGLFVSKEEDPMLVEQIIQMGMSMLAITPVFYCILGLVHSSLNTMAGAGDTMFSMVAMVVMMLLRVVLAWILIHGFGMDYHGIWWAFPISWAITLVFVLVHYFRGGWQQKAVLKAHAGSR